MTIVVVPARDEQRVIAACLEALAAQTIGTAAFTTILVDDACRDRTVAIARAAAERLGLALTVIDGPGAGSGPARAIGMDAAAEQLLSAGHERGLVATTDADSVPAPDWLERQLDHVARGADVVAGLIELNDVDAAALPTAVLRRRRTDAQRRLAAVTRDDPDAGHHHFAGASLGITAEVYRAVGGMRRPAALEDEAFAAVLQARGVPILRAADVRVRTAARTNPRADRGLGVDLAVSVWRERRRYAASDYSLQSLADDADAKTATVTVVIGPGRSPRAGVDVFERAVVPVRAAGLVDEVVLVVDDGLPEVMRSRDPSVARAAAAGARVCRPDELLRQLGPELGVGDVMWRALAASTGEIVCFLDPDTDDPDPRHLLGLLGPLLAERELAFVKGTFQEMVTAGLREPDDDRVTELTARPLLNLHFPLLAGFARPFGITFAARRELLMRVPFPVGNAVGLTVLIDALRERGLDALGESDLGPGRATAGRPLRTLGETAFAVLAAVERRVQRSPSATGGQFLRPWDDGTVVRVPVDERPPLRQWRAHSPQPRTAATDAAAAVGTTPA